MDFDKLMEKDEFKNIEPDKILAVKEIAEKAKGKTIPEIIKIMSSYKELFSSGRQISEAERNLMIAVMLESMPEAEKQSFLRVLKLGGINIE